MPTTVKVMAELDEKQKRIEVVFPYHADLVRNIKRVPGARFVRTGPHWTIPKDLDACRELREKIDPDRRGILEIGPELRMWATSQLETHRNLGSLAAATTAELSVLPDRLPDLYEAVHVGPIGRFLNAKEFKAKLKEPPSFQAADVAFMAQAEAPGNFNQPGTGKTIEVIAATYEAKLDHGLHIVACPLTSMESVWEMELIKWTDAWVLSATGNRASREAAIAEALRLASEGECTWLIVNPAMLAVAKDDTNTSDTYVKKVKPKEYDADMGCRCDRLKDPHWHYDYRYPEFATLPITQLIIDEAHDAALGNPNALTSVGIRKIGERAEKRTVMTATPMGGKPIKLFGILQYLRPDVFTSKYNWADNWLLTEQTDNGYGKNLAKAKLNPVKERRFNESLIPYVLRRTKEDVLPWLPPKQFVHLWCDMTDAQKTQYEKFAADADIRIGDEGLSATNVLAEYTRLRQFATAVCTISDGSLIPTTDSSKLPHLMQILEERGMVGEDKTDKEQVVIFSQFNEVVHMVANHLREKGVAVETLTGQTTQTKRNELQTRFQEGGDLQVLVMNVKAGGVSITLDRASTVVFMDETWNPDDQEQAEDRCHRASRIHQVTIYYLRTKETIEEYVFDTTTGKSLTNEQVLDIRRRMEEQPEMHLAEVQAAA